MFVILYLVCRYPRATAGFSNYNLFLPRTSSRRHSEESHTPSLQATRQKKKGTTTQDKKNTFCLARLALPRRGPKLHLDLHPPSSITGASEVASSRGALTPCAHCGRCDLQSRCSCPADPARWGQPACAHPCGVGGARCGLPPPTNQPPPRYRPQCPSIEVPP